MEAGQAEVSSAAVFFRLKPEATNARTSNVSQAARTKCCSCAVRRVPVQINVLTAAVVKGPAGAAVRDIKYACRVLLKTPGFTVVTVLSLGISIGARTTIFSSSIARSRIACYGCPR
jgi:hypothetical protein